MPTVEDTFDRADSTSVLGTTSDTTATWTVQRGTWGISGNAAYTSAVDGTHGDSLATVPGAADGSVEVTVVTGDGGGGVIFRCSDAASYWGVFSYIGSPGLSGLWKTVSGSGLRVAGFACSAGDVLHVDYSGDSIVVKQNGSTVATVTDSFNDTADLVGIYSDSAADRLDDFVADLGTSPPVIVDMDGETDVPLEWSADVAVSQAITSVDDDTATDDAWQVGLEWSCLLDLDPPDDVEDA